MRVVLSNWRPVIQGKPCGRFSYWSELVLGKGDESLPKEDPSREDRGIRRWLFVKLKWKKRIILVPRGEADTEFVIGYCLKAQNLCLASSAVRRISDGPFAMRISPNDIEFFVIGTSPVELEIAGYVKGDIVLY